MLNLNLTLTVQLLINLFAFVIPRELTPRGGLRASGGGPMGSSLPRHGARIRTKTQKKNKKTKKKTKKKKQKKTKKNKTKKQKQKQKPRADCKLAQKT